MEEIINARITNTMLGYEDHDILTFMVFVNTEHWDVGIGGYALDRKVLNGKRVFSAKGLEAIAKILDVVGVRRWEELPGKLIRIKDKGRSDIITCIGNIMKDKWIDLREQFAED